MHGSLLAESRNEIQQDWLRILICQVVFFFEKKKKKTFKGLIEGQSCWRVSGNGIKQQVACIAVHEGACTQVVQVGLPVSSQD